MDRTDVLSIFLYVDWESGRGVENVLDFITIISYNYYGKFVDSERRVIMKQCFKRVLALCLCIAALAGYIPALPTVVPTVIADAAVYNSYTTIARVPTQSPCSGMQGMDVDNTYIYCAKIDDDTTACIARVHKDTGALTWLTNSATGTKFFTNLLYHANDLAVCTINGVKTIFVGTGGAGKGNYSLVRLELNGTTLKHVGNYNMKQNGSSKYIAGVKVVGISSTEVSLVLKSGNYVFTGSIPLDTMTGDINMDYVGKLDFSAVNFGGTVRNLSDWVVQGFGYKDGMIFVPMTGNHQDSTRHISSIICFDIDGLKNTTLKPDSNMSVWIEDSTYPDLFEIESCAICPTDGKLYFGTNGRKTSSDGNHDGVHVLKNFVYNPALGDSTTGQNYHFRPSSGTMKSVTTGGAVYNSVIHRQGQLTAANKITNGSWSMDMPIILKHNEPWIITWESSNWTGNSLFLSTYDTSSFAGNKYLYRRSGSGLVALGYQGDGQYHNYGVMLSSHGIDDTQNHKYQLKNQVNADGTNMVYLWVDGKNLGAMNNYYIGASSQNKTDNWVSGKDFSFSYIGTTQHPVATTLQSLQVWTKGNINAFDEPSVFRWETQNDEMTPVSEFGYSPNALSVLGGSCTSGTYANYYAKLAKPVVLMHNRPWVVEWNTDSWSGNTMLFSSSDVTLKSNASYMYRSKDIVALGYSDGTKCHSYGIKLEDHGVSATAAHTYRLTNKINADGTNMIYLSVDGTELGPMNRYYLGSEYQDVTTDWANGKDFTFPYLGNYNYGLQQPYKYIQIWENGIPSVDTADKFRWEPAGTSFNNITSGDFVANTANRVVGSLSSGVFNEASYRLNNPIVLLHDRAWSISWTSSGTWSGSVGGAFLLAGSQTTGEVNAPYLYRRKDSGMLAFGYYNGSRHEQYGLMLSDYGIDGTVRHEYTLSNRINEDGSNMIYLSVDGQEVGPMNNYFVGTSPKGTTSDWLSGKDFTFPYLGTPSFPLSNVTMEYLEVNEGHAHSFGAWSGNDATCTSAGIQSRSCEICGYTENQTQPALGHSYQSVVTKPTCNAAGYTTHTCLLCGDSYTSDEVTSDGHSYEAVVTKPTCEAAGYTTYTCTDCGDSYVANPVSALGHRYQANVTDPTCTEEGYTTYTCDNCSDILVGNKVSALGHSYVDGYCSVCSAKDPSASDVVVPTLTLNYPSLSFEDEILYNVYYSIDNPKDVVEMGLITFASRQVNGTIADAVEVIPGYVSIGSTYMVQSNGIPAKNLSDAVYFKVYAKLTDGSYVYTDIAGYHAVAYANTVLNNAGSSAKAKALVVAMLNYGAEAQEYFGYKTESLMNAGLTAEQQALISAYDESMVQDVVKADSKKVGSFIMNGGYANIYPTVSFEGAFSINYYFVPNKAVDTVLTFYYWDSATYNSVATLTAENATGVITMTQDGSNWAAAIEGIAAKSIDETVYVAGYYTSGGIGYPTSVISYSLGKYCETIAANGEAFGAATAVYGYYAKAYFN